MKDTVPFQAAKSIQAFCILYSIPLGIAWQYFLMKRLMCHSSIIPYNSQKLLVILMKRFLPGFAKKISLRLNRRAKYAIKYLNFARAIKNMKLSMELRNYEMADMCADIIRQGRVGVSINLEKALEIAETGKRKGNIDCSCLIRLISYDMYTRESKRLRNMFRLCSREDFEHLNSLMPNMSDLTCNCKYCVTLKVTLCPRQHSQACLSAARDGYAPAQYDLGMSIFGYELLHYTHEKALYWFIRAAIQGHPDALQRVALNLFYGWGTEINLKSAYILFKRAKEAGNENSDEYITYIEKMMEE